MAHAFRSIHRGVNSSMQTCCKGHRLPSTTYVMRRCNCNWAPGLVIPDTTPGVKMHTSSSTSVLPALAQAARHCSRRDLLSALLPGLLAQGGCSGAGRQLHTESKKKRFYKSVHVRPAGGEVRCPWGRANVSPCAPVPRARWMVSACMAYVRPCGHCASPASCSQSTPTAARTQHHGHGHDTPTGGRGLPADAGRAANQDARQAPRRAAHLSSGPGGGCRVGMAGGW